MRITQLSVAEALASLHSGESGLSTAEAARRLAEFGPNRVEEIRGEPLVLRFAREFTHFFALILWLAAGLAFVAERYDPGTGMATLGAAIVGVILVNGGFSFWQEYRAERAIAALKNLLPHQVTLMRDDQECRLPAEALVPGDLILVQEGDDVPADCRVIEALALRLNAATLTGESLPRALNAEPSEETDLLAASNALLAGTSIISGNGRALVFATGMRTEFGKIARLTQSDGQPQSPLQREIARVSRLVAMLSFVLGVTFFAIGRLIGLPFWDTFIFAVGILVANVPEGLLPTVTLALAMATQRMARRNALIRHLPAVETLGSATVICTDKTGTLTRNRMTVRAVFLGKEQFGLPVTAGTVQLYRPFFEAAQHCQTLRQVTENGTLTRVGDPMETALAQMAESALGAQPGHPRMHEIPFDTDRRRMSTVHETPQGSLLYCKGAPEVVMQLCTSALTPEGVRALDEATAARFRRAQEAMAERGLRVLALACRTLPERAPQACWESELTLAGLAGIEDPPRAEVPDAVRRCAEAGIKVIMITGDHPSTACAIAREIGLVRSPTPVVVSGGNLQRMSRSQLQLALDAPEILFARESADMVLLDDNFATIVSAIEERLLSWPLLARAYLFLGALEAAAGMAAFFYVLHMGGWTFGELPGARNQLYLQATTACLAAIIVTQVVNVFLCRDPQASLFSRGLLGNRLLLLGVAAEIALMLAIVYMPWGQAVFGTAALTLDAWLFMLPLAAAMLLLEELRKMLVRLVLRSRE